MGRYANSHRDRSRNGGSTRVMQGDLWSRCLADAASKRRGGQSLGRETTGREVEVLQENRRHTEMQDADAETQAD